jgi:radical SAM-linked protein
MRLRIKFSKTGPAKYSGHLDLHKTWERICRRSGMPLAYSQGFHPQPKIQLAAALPLGFTSDCELVDVWVSEDVDLEKTAADLARTVAPGITVLHLATADESGPPLQTQLRSADFVAAVPEPPADLPNRVAELVAAPTLLREKRGKPYDLRPLIESLTVQDNLISMRLAARDGATGRPEEVLAALGLNANTTAVNRTNLVFAETA